MQFRNRQNKTVKLLSTIESRCENKIWSEIVIPVRLYHDRNPEFIGSPGRFLRHPGGSRPVRLSFYHDLVVQISQRGFI
jgi:hypothetical protein